MKEWKVLPTDEKYLSLTEEQKDYLWENYLVDHPEIQKQITNRFHDPEFNKEWEKLETTEDETPEESEKQVIRNDSLEDYDMFEAEYKAYLSTREDLTIPDSTDADNEQQDSPINMNRGPVVDDWEEVED